MPTNIELPPSLTAYSSQIHYHLWQQQQGVVIISIYQRTYVNGTDNWIMDDSLLALSFNNKFCLIAVYMH